MEEKIRAKIEKLKTERDAFVTQANQQIAALNGAIQVLEQLLAPEPEAAAANVSAAAAAQGASIS